jgi:hypothetical protein
MIGLLDFLGSELSRYLVDILCGERRPGDVERLSDQKHQRPVGDPRHARRDADGVDRPLVDKRVDVGIAHAKDSRDLGDAIERLRRELLHVLSPLYGMLNDTKQGDSVKLSTTLVSQCRGDGGARGGWTVLGATDLPTVARSRR